jgi:plastocyanin
MLAFRAAAVVVASLMFSFPTDPIQAQAPSLTIVVWSYGFSPHSISIEAGRPVTLTFENRSGSSHDFTAKLFFASSTIESGSAENGAIDLGPHQTKTITLIPKRGTYQAHCSHFMHATFGMTDEIIVR